jgi:ABC-type branched-subunit amino acid transport system substrate-binding protein
MHRSRLLIILLMMWGLLAIYGVGAQQPVFRIGVLDDETGFISKGAQLAVQEINAAGGVRGADGTFFQLELIIQPTGGGTNLPNAVANLAQANIIAALGPATNGEVINGMAQLQSLNVPVFTPATNDSILITDTTDRLFRSRAAQILQGQALAVNLINERGLRSIAVVQLDVESTDNVVGFASAAQALGVTPQVLLLQSAVNDLATTIVQSNPQVAVVFGNPELAGELFALVRQAGWTGVIAYDQVSSEDAVNNIPLSLRTGILSTTTWPFTATDASSDAFLGNYVRAFGEIPDAIAAASYDAVHLLSTAIGQPGELLNNLPQLDNIPGVQGLLRPAALSAGETSNTVAVVQINGFGVPQVAARYAGGVRLPDEGPIVSSPTPLPTATPDGVVVTVAGRPFQNVRSGPSTVFDVLGQLNEGESARVIGASRDNAWVVIDFRGRQGWMSASLLDIFGDLNTVPIIDSPPTPTPAFTPTPLPPQEADIIIESASAAPSPIIANQPFNVNVVVRNIGNSNAGQFAVAATFPPNNVYSAAIIPGLAAGQAITATLTGTLTNTGFYSVAIIADLNNQVPEGPGEANNAAFTFNYQVDKRLIREFSQERDQGQDIDLEGGPSTNDANWTGNEINALNGAKLGILQNVQYSQVHWDLISPSVVNQNVIPRTSMNLNTVIGVITADGNRGVIRVDGIPGNQLQITLKVYEN